METTTHLRHPHGPFRDAGGGELRRRSHRLGLEHRFSQSAGQGRVYRDRSEGSSRGTRDHLVHHKTALTHPTFDLADGSVQCRLPTVPFPSAGSGCGTHPTYDLSRPCAPVCGVLRPLRVGFPEPDPQRRSQRRPPERTGPRRRLHGSRLRSGHLLLLPALQLRSRLSRQGGPTGARAPEDWPAVVGQMDRHQRGCLLQRKAPRPGCRPRAAAHRRCGEFVAGHNGATVKHGTTCAPPSGTPPPHRGCSARRSPRPGRDEQRHVRS